MRWLNISYKIGASIARQRGTVDVCCVFLFVCFKLEPVKPYKAQPIVLCRDEPGRVVDWNEAAVLYPGCTLGPAGWLMSGP